MPKGLPKKHNITLTSCNVVLDALLRDALLRADAYEEGPVDIAFGDYDDEAPTLCDLYADEELIADCSPLTSLESSPVSTPTPPDLKLSEIPQLTLDASPDVDLSKNPQPTLGASLAIPHQSSSSQSSSSNPPALAAPPRSNKRKRKIAYQKRRARAKREESRHANESEPDEFMNHETYEGAEDKFVTTDDIVQVDFDSADLKTASTGFVGAKAKGLQRALALDDVVGPNSKYKFRLVKYTGRSRGIVDKERQMFAAVVAPPVDRKRNKTWKETTEHCADVLEEIRPKLYLTTDEKKHRRGKFPAPPFGISHGQGQPKPMNLKQHETNIPILESVRQDESFIRIAGHQSAAFRVWAPHLYKRYSTTMKTLLDSDKSLKMNFSNSIFACTSVNCGPRTICYRHNDSSNLPHGWCAITAFRNFSYTEGGHMILWDLGLVIEFPPGVTILIPSACISHSNVAIKQSETRYSMTQYTAGSIFRWVDYGCQSEADFNEGKEKEELEADAQKGKERIKEALSQYRVL